MQLDEGEIKEENGFSLENQPTMYTENVFQSSASTFATNKKNQPTQCDDQRLEMTTWSLHQGNCFSIRNDLRAKEKS